jgi:hypothetical protein
MNRSNFDVYTGDSTESESPRYVQDPWVVSKRVGAFVSGAASAGMMILTDPGVQTALPVVLQAVVPPLWLPVVTAGLSAGLAAWSKSSDPRPVKGKGEA